MLIIFFPGGLREVLTPRISSVVLKLNRTSVCSEPACLKWAVSIPLVPRFPSGTIKYPSVCLSVY